MIEPRRRWRAWLTRGLACASLIGLAFGQVEEEDDFVLSPDDDKALGEFVKEASAARGDGDQKGLEKAIESAVADYALDAAAKAKLTAALPEAAAAAKQQWEERFREWVLVCAVPNGSVRATIGRWQAKEMTGNVAAQPDETEAWERAMKEALSPEQWDKRARAKAEKLAKSKEDITDYLSKSEPHAETTFARLMDEEIQELKLFVALDPDRLKKLEQASTQAIAETVKGWKGRGEKQLLEMNEVQREQTLKSGGYLGVNYREKGNQPRLRKVWMDTLAATLKPEESQTLAARREAAKTVRCRALAMGLVGATDRFLGLDRAQREALVKIAAPRLRRLPREYFHSTPGIYYSTEVSQMWPLVSDLKAEELAPVNFTEGQMKRWRELEPQRFERYEHWGKLEAPENPPSAEEMNEVEMDIMLTKVVHRAARHAKAKARSVMEAELEALARVTNLSPEALATLQTAAKGSAELLAQSAIQNTDNWLRGQFQNVKPADFLKRFEQTQGPYFSERTQGAPSLWTSAVARVLTAEQRAAWETEERARNDWRFESLTEAVMTRVDQEMDLPSEKRAALAKKVEAAIRKYDEEFTQTFSPDWHLQSYYGTIPLAMLEDKELAEVLDKAQIDTLKERCLGESANMAQHIRQRYENRSKNK